MVNIPQINHTTLLAAGTAAVVSPVNGKINPEHHTPNWHSSDRLSPAIGTEIGTQVSVSILDNIFYRLERYSFLGVMEAYRV